MSAILRALAAKLIRTDADDRRAPHLRELLFSATRQAFAMDAELDHVAAVELLLAGKSFNPVSKCQFRTAAPTIAD